MRRTRPLLAALLLFGACSEEPTAPPPPDSPQEQTPPPARVLVVNSLSETLSNLDPKTGHMTVQAALLGSAANRVRALPEMQELLVAASGDNQVQILDAADLSLRGGIDVGVGSSPWLAVPISPTQAIVSDWLSGDVRALDLPSRSASAPLATTPGPEGIAVSGRFAYVACTNYSNHQYGEGYVDVVDLDAWTVLARVAVSTNPQDVMIAPDGRVHVLCTGTYGAGADPGGNVNVLDPAALEVVGVVSISGSPGRLAIDASGVVWVAGFSGGVQRYSASELAILPQPEHPALRAPGLSSLAADWESGRIYVTNFESDLLIAVDGATLEVDQSWFVGDGPVDVFVFRPESDALSRRAVGPKGVVHRELD